MPKDNQDELFIVVNEKDEIIGYKKRFECHQNKKLIHREIDIVLFDKKNRILLQKRSQDKDTYPNFYTISVSGHVIKGETYRQTADRELKEELGITIPLKKIKRYIAKLPNETEMATLFIGKYKDEKLNIDNTEVKKTIFLDKVDIKKMLNKLTPGAIICLKQLKIL